MSDFDPTLEGGEPLDLSSMMPVQAQAPQTRPQLPQPAQKPSGFAQAALAALLPLAAKRGGRPAIAALMQGLQQAQAQAQQTHNTSEQQRFQNERLMAGDERAQAQQVATQQHQQAVQGNQQRTAQANLLKDYAAKVSVAESAEQIAALKETFGYAAQVLGIPASTVDAIASKAAPTSSALIERQVKKVIKDLKPEQLDHFAQNEMAIQVPGQGLPIPYAEWSKYLTAGIGKDGKPVVSVKKPNAVNPGSFEEYVNLPPEMQALREQQRKKFNQSDDRAHPGSTILIQTIGPDGQPVQQIVPKTPGAVFPVAQTPTQQTKISEEEAALAAVANIEALFRPEYVGPVAGRKTRAQMVIPGAPDVSEDVASFYSATAALRNEMIKLFSGAAVSGSEESRMKAQLPDVTQKPNVFKANLAQTKRNRETLLSRMKVNAGQPGSAAGSKPAVGARVRNKQTGELAEVTGYTKDGQLILKPVQGQ